MPNFEQKRDRWKPKSERNGKGGSGGRGRGGKRGGSEPQLHEKMKKMCHMLGKGSRQ